jgi:putative addiction module killer protein
MKMRYTLRHYITEDDSDVIIEWLRALNDLQAVSRIIRRLDRARSGNFGDHSSVGEGVWELRIDYGPGYRVYYCFEGDTIVLLLAGGDKATQITDIKIAKKRKTDYERG